MRRITVNLAPADLKKAGPSYDLSIAVGILSSSGQITADISQAVFLGELSLDGSIKHVNGVLPMVGHAEGEGIGEVYVPAVDSKEASLLNGVTVYPAGTLGELASHLRGQTSIAPYEGSDEDELSSRAVLGRRRPGVRARPGARQAGSGGGGCRWAQPPDERPARQRQDSPCTLPAIDSAGHELLGVAGPDEDIQRGRTAAVRYASGGAPTLPSASLHHIARRARRRR